MSSVYTSATARSKAQPRVCVNATIEIHRGTVSRAATHRAAPQRATYVSTALKTVAIFTARRYASLVFTCLFVCLSVCLSITSRNCVELVLARTASVDLYYTVFGGKFGYFQK